MPRPREFSCEHCGRPETRQAPRRCDANGCAMCHDCTEEHDAGARCPDEPKPEGALGYMQGHGAS